MDHAGELILGLMVAVAALSTIARLINVPYPILLVIGGVIIGALPGLPDVEMDPDLVLVLFLPPLLYSAAFFSSLRDLKANLRAISMLAVGLVIVTAAGVAVVAHAVIDGMSWGAAFTLGAIVSPTDPLAATAIARAQGAPRRVITVVEGESLINDGTALVIYRAAVAAVVAGSFSLADAGLDFIVGIAGGIAIGLLAGYPIAEIRKRLNDPPVEITISLATAYAAYLPAEQLGFSGVIAAVTVGIYLGWRAPEVSSAEMRMQGRPVWELLVFLLNATLFVLIGLQLPIVLDSLEGWSTGELTLYAFLICLTVVGLRLLWLNTMPYAIRLVDRRESQRERRVGWQLRLIVGWSGMRGAVSLAAALAIPNFTDAGEPFPQRDLILFLAFSVILFTVVVQGLTLPALIRRLNVGEDSQEGYEEIRARMRAAEAALERLDELESEDWVREETAARIRRLHEYRIRRFRAQKQGDDSDGIEDRSMAYQRLLRELLEAQHRAIVAMRNEGLISNDVMTRIERDLDLEDSRLEI